MDIFVKNLQIFLEEIIFGNFYLYFSMYNITLSYFFWLFWRSKEHLFRNFFFSFQISSRTITWSLSLGARQVRMPRSIPIHFFVSCRVVSCLSIIWHIINTRWWFRMRCYLTYQIHPIRWPLTLNLPIWHVFPIQPGGQIHSKSLILLMHSAPFEHGCSIHSSISFSHRGP